MQYQERKLHNTTWHYLCTSIVYLSQHQLHCSLYNRNSKRNLTYVCMYGREKEIAAGALFCEFARAIFRDKKQYIFSARIELVEFTLTIEHPVIRNGTFDGTNIRIVTRRKVGAALPQAGSISSAIKQSNGEHKETSALLKASCTISYQEMGRGWRASLRRRESWERCFWLISVNSSDRFSRFTFS